MLGLGRNAPLCMDMLTGTKVEFPLCVMLLLAGSLPMGPHLCTAGVDGVCPGRVQNGPLHFTNWLLQEARTHAI